MAVAVRKDSPHPSPEDLAYPPRADSRGLARKSWKSDSYNFGKHNTPESWLLFCEWRKHLIQTGEAIRTADVRAKLEETGVIVSDNLPAPMDNRRPSLLVYAAATIALCIVTGITVKLLSSASAPTADEFSASLTDEEKETILNLRKYDAAVVAKTNNRAALIAARLATIREGKQHDTDVTNEGNGS